MRNPVASIRRLALAGITVTFAGLAAGEDVVRIEGASCDTTPILHCPDSNCHPAVVINEGTVVEMQTRRTYFLDYPCDLRRGEKVTFVLNLHGGGSYGNWQRHYFPIMDYKDQYRLVVATPNSPVRVWSEADDVYLQNIVEFVYGQLGEENIGAFWLAGHSQGGQTSNRLLMTDFFRDRPSGWVSLSGGRLGSKREAVRAPIPFGPGAAPGPSDDARRPPPRLVADASILPDHAFSHLYVTGEHELTDAGLPGSSSWAEKLGCGPQTRRPDVVDRKGGYVYDSTRQDPGYAVWGFLPGPGTARVFDYPDCDDGHVVADIVRMDKGHTEGLEPKVTEEIVRMMLSAGKGR
jgi:hypothetical protein